MAMPAAKSEEPTAVLLAGGSRPAAVDGKGAAASFTTPRLATLSVPSAPSTSRISGRSRLNSPNSSTPAEQRAQTQGHESALQRDERRGPEFGIVGDLQAAQLDLGIGRRRTDAEAKRTGRPRIRLTLAAARAWTRGRSRSTAGPDTVRIRTARAAARSDPEGEPLHRSPQRTPTRSGWP